MSSPDPPFVPRPNEPPPLVLPVTPPAPRPGLLEAFFLTAGFAVVLFGSIIAIVMTGWLVAVLTDANGLDAPADAKPNTAAALPPVVADLLAWSFPVGYFAGFLACLAAFRWVGGRGWTRDVGLRQLPVRHLALGVLALPAFVILSDGLAKLLFKLFGLEHLLDQAGGLGDLFRGFHPAFVALAVGVGPGVVEELWCRGFLGRGLVGRYGWVRGVALASLFFGLLHLYPPPYVLVTAVMGATLHFQYICSRSLWVPIVVHTLNNGFAGLAAVGAVSVAGMDRTIEQQPALVFGLSAVLLLACGWAAWTGRAVAPDGPPGVMVPAGGVRVGRPNLLSVAVAVVSCGALLWLMAS